MIIHSPIISGSLTFAQGATMVSSDSGVSGSFSGSFQGDGSQLTNVAASGLNIDLLNEGPITGDDFILFSDQSDSGTEKRATFKTALNSEGVFSGSAQVQGEVGGDLIPAIHNTYDLGSTTKYWRDLYLSSGSLYINGQQVLSTTGTELRITTDAGESIKILEAGNDTITLETENGDITLTASGTGNIELDAPIQIAAGNQVLSSDGNPILFGEDINAQGNRISATNIGNVAGTSTFTGSFVGDGTALSGVTSYTDSDNTAHLNSLGVVSGSLNSSRVGLGNVDNTSDANKPVSTATQTALDLKAPLASPTFTGTVSGVSATHVGLGNVDNTSDANKPVSTATQTALDLKANLASPSLTGNPTAPTQTGTDDSTKIATTAFVQDRIDTIIGTAGSTLDTLGELSASLSDDEDALTSLTTTVGGKLQKDQNLSDLTDAATARTNLGLGSVEDGADVTDTANVTAAGALMDSEVTNLAQVKAFDSSDYATAAQGTLADSAQQPPSEGAFANGDKTKLDGIEASADVTDTDNVTAAGALMDSEVTNLSQVKSFDSSDYATAAQGTKADSAQQPPSEGAFVDGDKTKLDGIEASADVTDTANVTAAGALMDSELTDLAGVKGVTISTLQPKPSEGAFANGDKTKLDGIEASADVTDTANVTAAGALMDSEVTDLDGIKSLTVPNDTTISTFGASLVDDANAGAARTTLGLGTSDTVEFGIVSASTDLYFEGNLIGSSTSTGSFGRLEVNASTIKIGDQEIGETQAETLNNASGTNTGDVTLVGSYDYLSISGQAITLGQVDAATDISNLTTSNVSEGTNEYFTDARAQSALSSHTDSTSNPHSVTATQVGLGNVTNESKATMFASPTFTGTVSGVSKSHVGLGNVDNTSDANKPVSTATQTALDLKANLDSPALTGNPTAPTQTGTDDSTKIATTAFVQDRIDTIIGTAGSTLDTLGELSASLSDDEDALTVLTTTVGGKLQKDQNLSDLTNASTARTNLGVDAAGTDNSTNVTLAGGSYLSISGQEITAGQVDISSHTNLAVSDTTGQTGINMTLSGDTISGTVSGLTTTSAVQFGTVGIGTGTPGTLLELKESSNGAGDAVIRLRGHGNNTDNTVLGALEFFNADSSGDQPGVVARVEAVSGNANGHMGELVFKTHDGTEGGEGSDPVERMRIDSTGNLGLGIDSPGAKLDVSGDIRATGDVVAFASSDERLKDNVELISNPIEKVKELRGVTWEWNEAASDIVKQTPNVGVIAQEVEKVLPELVHDRENGYKGVDYSKLTGLLIEVVKTQQEKIESLESRLEKLEK
jgi:hypothetical protein